MQYFRYFRLKHWKRFIYETVARFANFENSFGVWLLKISQFDLVKQNESWCSGLKVLEKLNKTNCAKRTNFQVFPSVIIFFYAALAMENASIIHYVLE